MAEITLGDGNGIILDMLTEKVVLANTIKVEKADGNGAKFASVDMYVEPLEDVSVKVYTETDRANDVDFDFDNISWTPINITLGAEIYVGLQLSGVDNLIVGADNVADLAPYYTSLSSKVARSVETVVGSTINGLSGANLINETYVGTTRKEKGLEVIAKLQELSLDFDDNGVETENRTAVLGRNTGLNLLATDELLHASKVGEETPLALRKAIVGEIANFTVIISDKVDPDALVVYHSNAFGIASKAPEKNVSANYSEVTTAPDAPINVLVSVLGLGARNKTGILVETFYGVKELVVAGQTSNPRAKKVVFG
jgi:hypothetical protein